MKVQVITEGPNSTKIMWDVIKKCSNHEIEVIEWRTDLDKKPDIILYSCMNWITEVYPIIEKHPEINFFMTLTDYANFRKAVGYQKSNNYMFEKLSGILPCGEAFMDICKEYTENIPLFMYDSGVDTTLFKRKDKPIHFSIGSGEHYPQSQIQYFNRFLKYPYPKYTSSEHIGTFRPYVEMPEFYETISVLVDPTTDARPGGMMFLEAGAVGRPSVAIKEGILAKWFPERLLAKDDNEIINILHKLHNDERFYQDVSDEWYQIAQSRDYKIVAEEFDVAFNTVVRK